MSISQYAYEELRKRANVIVERKDAIYQLDIDNIKLL